MGNKKNKNQQNKQDMTIPDSATVIPSSSDATQKTREKGSANTEGLSDSTKNSF